MKEKKINIHEGHRKRLRKSVDRDCEMDALSDFEVLEYLLAFLIPRKDTNPIAHALIDEFGSLYGVFNSSKNELFEVKDMTSNAAHLLPNLTAIVRRVGLSRIKANTSIQFTENAVEMFQPYFINRNCERLYMASIDINDKLIQIDLLSEGLSSFTSVDFSKVISIAARNKPNKVILAHNHPGGNENPSNDDIALTSSLVIVLETIGIRLIDHIIFTQDNYYSFYENNIMLDHIRKADSIYGTNLYKEVRNREENNKYVLEPKLNVKKNRTKSDAQKNKNLE